MSGVFPLELSFGRYLGFWIFVAKVQTCRNLRFI